MRRYVRLTNIALLICLFIGNCTVMAGTTIVRVNKLSSCSTCDGQTWATAYHELSDALAFGPQPSAGNVVQLWVAGGVYKPTTGNNRNASFDLKNYMEIYGGFAGTETTLSDNQHLSTNRTFLSGDIGQAQTVSAYKPSSVSYPPIDTFNFDPGLVDNVYNVVTAYHVDVPNSCTLSAVTITGGFAFTTADLTGAPGLDQDLQDRIIPGGNFYNSLHTDAGGGMYLSSSKISVLACAFVANYARGYGGALAMDSSAPYFSNCTFANNYARTGGGAVFELNSIPNLRNSLFSQNITNGGGGALLSIAFPDQAGVAGNSIANKLATAALNAVYMKLVKSHIYSIDEPGYKTVLTGIGLVSNGLSVYSHTLNDPSFQAVADNIASTWNKWGGESGAITQLAIYLNDQLTTQADKDRSDRIAKKRAQLGSVNSSNYTLVYDCTFDNNYARGNGGAVSCSHSNIWFNRIMVSNNRSGFSGGGMAIDFYNACIIQNALFHHNYAAGSFSGILNSTTAQTQIINSTFVKNSAPGINGECIASVYGSEVKLANCVLWGNTDSIRPNGGADVFCVTRATMPQAMLNAAGNSYLDYTGIIDLYSTTLQQFPNIEQGYKEIIPACLNPNCFTQESGAANVGEGFMIYTNNNGYNPQLDSTNNYYPTNISPVINTGDNYYLSYGNLPISQTEDYLGGARQLDNTVDRGAIEFGNGAYVPYNNNGRIYVDQHALAGGDGTSWGSAFRTMQEAFNVINHSATPVLEVWVAKGIYYPSSGNDRSATFLVPGNYIRYYGGFAGNETSVSQRNVAANTTILSGDIGVIGDSTDNSYHVLYTKDYIDPLHVSLDGFTIADGNANGANRNSSGGGLYIQDDNQNGGYPALLNCNFLHNRAAQSGGAVFTEKTMGAQNCNFQYNYALNYGGAVTAQVSQLLTACVFKRNAAKKGGAVAGLNKYLPVTHERCTFLYNSATDFGGAVYQQGTDLYNIKECLFGSNVCAGSTNASGAAVYVTGDQYLTVSTGASTFANNALTTSTGAAAAIYVNSPALSNGIINSCIFWGNTVNGSTRALPFSRTQVYGIEKLQLLNTCFQNYGVDPNPPYSTTGSIYALGNIYTDPQFVFADTANYRLKSCSPAIGLGGNYQNLLVDLDSATRLAGGTYDMGAYEFHGTVSSNGFANVTASATGVCPGGSLKLFNQRTNPGFVPDSVRWQVDKGDGLGYTSISNTGIYTGATTDTLRITSAPVTINNYIYRCANYSNCSITSSDYQLYVYGDVIYVDASATGIGSGASWANAYTSLYDAITDADSRGCAQVWVKQGTYNSSANGSATQSLGVRSGVAVYGGFAGTETSLSQRNWQANITTIQRYGSTYIMQASGNNIADSTAILDGFTVTGGSSNYGSAFYVYGNNNPTINNCTFINNHANVNGGALHVDSGRISLNNCRFINNTANADGGALYIWNHAQATITNCVFQSNTANRWGGALAMLGNAQAVLTNCNFTNNSADAGGALKLDSIPGLSVFNCTFTDNHANGAGGGAYITSVPGALLKFSGTAFTTNNSLFGGGLMLTGNGHAYFTGCSFTANRVRWYGGGMAVQGGTLHLYNSTVSANHANTDLNNNRQGTGIYLGQDAGHEIFNCTIVGNYNELAPNTTPTAAGVYCNTATVTIANSLVYTNQAGNFTTLGTQMASAQGTGPYATTYYSCVYGGNASNNNLVTNDPQLVEWPHYDSITGNLHLLACSPLINAGSAAYLHTYVGDSIITDIETNPRRYNGTMVDIGAYEAQRNSSAVNPVVSPFNTLLSYCPGNANTVTLNATGNNSYQWFSVDSLGAGTPLNDDNVVHGVHTCTLNFTDPPLSYNQSRYQLIATSIDGCNGYGYVTLSVFKSRIYVDSTKVNGLNNGTSWANAYTRLTDALTYAAANPACHTEIWVAKGTYYPTATTNRSATFNWPDNVSIFGGFNGYATDTALSNRDYVNNVTILSGDIGIKGNNADNSYVVITAANNISETSRLDGFTITGGNGGYGGTTGAGLVMVGAARVYNCNFINNTALEKGGAVWLQGNALFYNCNYFYNISQREGSAIYITGGSPRIINGTFKANSSSPDYAGSTISVDAAKPYIYNSLISGNSNIGINAGNGSHVFVGSTTIAGNAVHFNLPGVQVPAGIYSYQASFEVVNSIVWGNSFNGVVDTGTQVFIDIDSIAVSNSSLQTANAYPGLYNYNTDPLFVDATDPALAPTMQGDLHLQNCSYLIDKGDNSYTTPGQVDVSNSPRIYNSRIDIGAYELQDAAAATINVPANALRDTSVCAGEDVSFVLPAGITGTFTWQINTGSGYTAITSGGLYSGYNTSTLVVQHPTAAMNGYRYRCKVTSPGGCYFLSQPATLTIKPFSQLVIGGLQDGYCLHYSQQINLNAIIDGTNYFNQAGTFYGRGLVSNVGDFSPVAAGLGPDTLYLAYTNSYGCSDTVSKIVNIVNPPDVNALGYKPTICRGDSVVLTLPAAVAYHWSTGDTTQSLSIINSGTYGVTVSSGGICTASNSYSVTVYDYPAKPYITTIGLPNICSGLNQTVTLVANGGAGNYLWSNGSTAAQITVNGNAAGAYAVSSYSQSPSCRAVSDSVTVGVFTPPSAAIIYNGPADLCGHDSAVLSAPSAAAYLWSMGQQSASIKAYGGSYSVTVTDAHACTASGSITVNNTGVKPVVYAPNGLTNCNGNGVLVYEAGGDNNIYYPVYEWYRVGSPDSLVETANGFNITESGTYYLVIQTSTGCIDTSDLVVVNNITPAPVSFTPPSGSDICKGQQVSVDSLPGFSYEWYKVTLLPNFTTVFTKVSETRVYTPGPQQDQVLVRVTDPHSGCVVSAGYVYSFSTVYTSYTGNICENNFVNVSASGSSQHRAVLGYQWSTGDTSQNIVGYDAAYTVTVQFDGCTVIDTVKPAISPRTATIALTANNNNDCQGTTVSLTATTTYAGSHPHYAWFKNGQNINAADTSYYSSSTLHNGDTIKCMLISSNVCVLSDTVFSNEIVIHQYDSITPSAAISVDGNNLCLGMPLTFSSTVNGGGGNPFYHWLLNDSLVSTSTGFASSSLNPDDVVQLMLVNNSACATVDTVYSDTIVVHLFASVTPVVTIAADANPACAGGPVTFTVTNLVNAGPNPSYVWVRNNSYVYVNAPSVTFSDLQEGEQVQVRLLSTLYCSPAPHQFPSNVITVHFVPSFNTAITDTICAGTPYNFNGTILTATGVYSDTLQSITGCDSIVTLTLTVNPALNTSISQSICAGSAYNFNGTVLTAAGTYNDTLQSITGCDSIVTLTLTVNPVLNTSFSQSICAGSSYNFNGMVLTATGVYNDTLQSITGCDSIVTLTLTVNPALNTSLIQSICAGSAYNFHGMVLNAAGVYSDTLQSITGCDSIVTLTLIVNPALNTSLSQIICAGSAYDFNGTVLTAAGTYSDTLQSITGCDSIVTLTLTVNSALNTSLSQTICAGSSYDFNGMIITAAGVYSDTLQSITGCDSIVTLTLTVNPALNTSISQSICAGSAYNFNGTVLNAAGVYIDTLQSITGCDSIVTLTLIVNPALNTSLSQGICTGSSYDFNGMIITAAGVYSDTLQSITGCDSIVTLTVTLQTIDATATVNGAVCVAAENNATYQWVDCNTGQPISGDTLQTFTAQQNGSYKCIVHSNGCIDTTNCVQVVGLSINEQEAIQYKLYPNPNHGYFTLQHNYPGHVSVYIYNAIGGLIFEEEEVSQNHNFNIESLGSGIYEVKLMAGRTLIKVLPLVRCN